MAAGRLAPHLVLIGESGLFLNPLVRRSWALKETTPVFGGAGGHGKMVSAIGGGRRVPGARRLGLYFDPLPDGYFATASVTAFLRDLLQHKTVLARVIPRQGASTSASVYPFSGSAQRRAWANVSGLTETPSPVRPGVGTAASPVRPACDSPRA